LICKFCSQWNPEGEPRCCFCDNALDAEEDATLSGRPSYTKNTGASLPKPLRSMFAEKREEPFPTLPDTITLTPRTIGIIAGALGVIVLLLVISRC
jgi:hypothetical protein